MTAGASRSPYLDWSVVTDDHVDQALQALLTVERMADRWDGITEFERAVHRLILTAFVETGLPPSFEELGASVELGGDHLREVLWCLVNRDLILFDGDEIAGAYPFSARPTRHSVTLGELSISAICAIDALGVASMVGTEATMDSTCPVCDKRITVHVGRDGLSVFSSDPVSTVIWAGLSEVGRCAAETQCQSMLAFCSDTHLEEWRDGGHPGLGFRFTPSQAVQAGAAIFRPFFC